MSSSKELVLRYSHNIIEHLGLKLYQNRPTNVIAELISNAWDADAHNIWIDLNQQKNDSSSHIAFSDDGRGMTFEEIDKEYLIIGHRKRGENEKTVKSQGGRNFMGRKGIGKLAPFGIARKIDIISLSPLTQEVIWFQLDLDAILGNLEIDGEYKINVIYHGNKNSQVPFSKDPTDRLEEFLGRIEDKGTLIILQNLSIKKEIKIEDMQKSIGQRFTVACSSSNFNIYVDKNPITQDQAMPKFDYKIPENGAQEIDRLTGRQVKYWVGFIKHADWPQDQSGVGIYSHGKIAQDRPFTFGVKGKEIWTRYMYGVIEADWLDELTEDVISTDRTSVNWEHEATQELYEWGQNKVREWISKYKEWRENEEKGENLERLTRLIKEREIPKVSEAEQAVITNLLSEVTPRMGKDETAKKQLISAVANAWTHLPMRKIIKGIWDQLSDQENLTPESFTQIIQNLSDHTVPESLSLAVTFAQRAYALSILYHLIHTGKEPDLQKLIERFPWIVRPGMQQLTANRQLKTAVEKAEEKNLISTHFSKNIAGTKSTYRPDFVFLSDPESKEIHIIELKTPRQELTVENREQLHGYMVYLESRYPNSKILGELIGTKANLQAKNEDMNITSWEDIFLKSRQSYVELLAAMLDETDLDRDDSRVQDIKDFGGAETINLLNKIAENNEHLQDLLSEFPISPAN